MSVNRLLLLTLVSTGTLMGGLGVIPAQASLPPGQEVPQGTVAATDPGPVPELATEYSNTVRNADGSYTAEVSAGPVNYQDDSGEWTPISNDMVEAPGAAYAVENEANDYTVSIPENPASTPVRFELDGDWVSMKLAGSNDVDPAVDGNEASFEDLTPTADEVIYEATDSGVKETIVLDATPTSPVSYVYNLKVSPEVTPVLTEQGIVEFRDRQGAPQFVIPLGNMTDSTVPEPAFSGAVDYDLQEVASGWKFTITPDLGWLTDPARVYPVMVDPTVDKITQKDCYLVQEAASTSYCGQGILKVGANNSLYKRRALLDFNINGIPAGSTIHNATAWIWMDQYSTAGTGGATTYALHNPASAWGGCATWNGSCSAGSWTGGGSLGQISSNTQSMGGTASGWQTWDITGRTAGWLNGTEPNRGVLLRQTGENVKKVLGFVSSTHSNTGLRPLLRINYTEPPPPEPDPEACDVWINGDTYQGIDPNLSPAEYAAAEEREANACFTYSTAARCQYNDSVYETDATCTEEAAEPNDRGTGTTDADDEPVEPRGCPDCPAGSGGLAWGGAFAGPLLGNPSGGFAWAVNPGGIIGTLLTTAATVALMDLTNIQQQAVTLGVPWPDPNSATAQKHRNTKYKLYTIYSLKNAEHYFRTWKYGITRQVADLRPASQLSKCAAYFSTLDGVARKCGYRWIQKNIPGFYAARALEAGFTTRYVFKFGHCPPGQPTCM